MLRTSRIRSDDSARGLRREVRDPFGARERYLEAWRAAFDEQVGPALRPGVRVLDVGAGRKPTIAIEERPQACHYVGLDVSRDELELASPGSYDEIYVADVACRLHELENRFDLIVSWQVLEHVKPLAPAVENLRAYLQEGGLLVAQFSGAFSVFAIANRRLPTEFSVRALHRLLGRDSETVFRAYYDRCYYSALAKLFEQWSKWDIVPRYRGASYFPFSRSLQALYLRYEDWISAHKCRNLATHYIVAATR